MIKGRLKVQIYEHIKACVDAQAIKEIDENDIDLCSYLAIGFLEESNTKLTLTKLKKATLGHVNVLLGHRIKEHCIGYPVGYGSELIVTGNKMLKNISKENNHGNRI